MSVDFRDSSKHFCGENEVWILALTLICSPGDLIHIFQPHFSTQQDEDNTRLYDNTKYLILLYFPRV